MSAFPTEEILAELRREVLRRKRTNPVLVGKHGRRKATLDRQLALMQAAADLLAGWLKTERLL